MVATKPTHIQSKSLRTDNSLKPLCRETSQFKVVYI